MLLQGLLANQRVKKELAPLLILRRTPRITTALGHVIPPLLVQLRQTLEFLLKLIVFSLSILKRKLQRFLFQGRIRLNLLLDQVAQFQHRRLQNNQALLKLRRKNLRLGEALRLR